MELTKNVRVVNRCRNLSSKLGNRGQIKDLQRLSRHDRLVEWKFWEPATYDLIVRQIEFLIKLLFVLLYGKGFF